MCRACTAQTITEDDRVRLMRQLDPVKLPPGGHEDPRNALFELFERVPPPDA